MTRDRLARSESAASWWAADSRARGSSILRGRVHMVAQRVHRRGDDQVAPLFLEAHRPRKTGTEVRTGQPRERARHSPHVRIGQVDSQHHQKIESQLCQARVFAEAFARQIMAELGHANFNISAWTGVFVPASTPDATVTRLNTEFVAALKDPLVRERMAAFGVQISASTPQEADAFVKGEMARWSDVIRRYKIKPE